MSAGIPEAQAGLAARGIRRHPSIDVVLNGVVEMRAHLFGAIAVLPPPVEKSPEAHDGLSITRPTAATS